MEFKNLNTDELSMQRTITIPKILEMDSIVFEIIRKSDDSKICFSNLTYEEKQTIIDNCTEAELKRICLFLSNRIKDFRHPYELQNHKKVDKNYKIHLVENIYFVVYYDYMLDRNGCFVYNGSSNSNLYNELKNNIGDEHFSYDKSVEMVTSPSVLSFSIKQINSIYNFCRMYKIDASDFFYSFFEYFKDDVDYEKIKLWILEIIEPNKPKLVERVKNEQL